MIDKDMLKRVGQAMISPMGHQTTPAQAASTAINGDQLKYLPLTLLTGGIAPANFSDDDNKSLSSWVRMKRLGFAPKDEYIDADYTVLPKDEGSMKNKKKGKRRELGKTLLHGAIGAGLGVGAYLLGKKLGWWGGAKPVEAKPVEAKPELKLADYADGRTKTESELIAHIDDLLNKGFQGRNPEEVMREFKVSVNTLNNFTSEKQRFQTLIGKNSPSALDNISSTMARHPYLSTGAVVGGVYLGGKLLDGRRG